MTALRPPALPWCLALVVSLVVPLRAAGEPRPACADGPCGTRQGSPDRPAARGAACHAAAREPGDEGCGPDTDAAIVESPGGQQVDDGDEPARGDARLLAPGRTIIGGFASRGWAQVINGSADIDIDTVALRWSRVFGREGERFLGAYPAIGVELIPATLFDQEPTAWAAGFHVMYEHRFVSAGVLPVLRLGAGFLYGNDQVPPGETRHNFSLLAGLGVDIPVGGKAALGLEYRLHHVSNAGTGEVNPGINAHTAAVSLSFYF